MRKRRTARWRKEEANGAEKEAQMTTRDEVEEREEGEERRRTDESVWDPKYSPEYIHS